MAHEAQTSEERLTPEARRALLRDFADRMLLKVTSMDDPEDMPGVERAVRSAAAIERIYSRCDRAEAHARVQAPALKKAEAEHARAARDAIEARVALAGTLEWGAKRSRDLGQWWDAADTSAKASAPGLAPGPPPIPAPAAQPATPARPVGSATVLPDVRPAPAQASEPDANSADTIDYTDAIRRVRAQMGMKPAPEGSFAGRSPGLSAAPHTCANGRAPPT